jgi:uncharacterized protein YjiS (DUF1127 family)
MKWALYGWARERQWFLAHPRSWPHRSLELLREWYDRGRQRWHLRELDDRMLQDIGVTRAEAEAEWDKPFWTE